MASPSLLIAPPPADLEIPTAPEIVCRYLLGWRYPDMKYLDAVESYLDTTCWPGVGGRAASFLEWLAPDQPLEADSARGTRTAWALTPKGTDGAIAMLGRSMGDCRLRRFSRQVIIAMAILGAAVDEGNARFARTLATALPPLAPTRIHETVRPERDGPLERRAVSVAEIAAAFRRVGLILCFSPTLHRRVLGPGEGSSSIGRCLGQLERWGLVRRFEIPVGLTEGGIVRPVHVARLRELVRKGEVRLSPLALGMLRRRIDRRPRSVGEDDWYRVTEDSKVLMAIAGAHLRSATATGIHAVAEQVVLVHPAQSFNPARFRAVPLDPGRNESATKRVDMVLWGPDDHPAHPSRLVELERPTASSSSLERFRSHLEAATLVSASGTGRSGPVFVAHHAARSRVTSVVSQFRDQFAASAGGLWAGANLEVKVISLRDALHSGLDEVPVSFSTQFTGRRSNARPAIEVPIAMLRRCG